MVWLVADAQDAEGLFGFPRDCPGGLGDVGGAEDLQGTDGEVAERGHGGWRGSGVNGGGVLAEGDVPDVVRGVLDPHSPRMNAAIWAGVAWWASRLVTA